MKKEDKKKRAAELLKELEEAMPQLFEKKGRFIIFALGERITAASLYLSGEKAVAEDVTLEEALGGLFAELIAEGWDPDDIRDLLDEVATGREWSWPPEGPTIVVEVDDEKQLAEFMRAREKDVVQGGNAAMEEVARKHGKAFEAVIYDKEGRGESLGQFPSLDEAIEVLSKRGYKRNQMRILVRWERK